MESPVSIRLAQDSSTILRARYVYFTNDPSHFLGPGMTLDELQQLIDRMYSRKDQARGVEGTFMWLMEEIGELAAALRESPKEEIAKEFADVLAWLATIANVAGINLTEAVQMKYGHGCPGCKKMVCVCADSEKP